MAGIQASVPAACQTLLTELPLYEVGDWLLGTRLPHHNSPLLPSRMAPQGPQHGGRHRAGLGPTYLDFARPNFKGLDDAGQEVFDMLEVTVAYTPGPIHQEDHVHRHGGCAAELGSAWGGRGGR